MERVTKERIEALERAAFAKLRAELEFEVLQLKAIYGRLPDEGKKQLKSWLQRIMKLRSEAPSIGPCITVNLVISQPIDDENENVAKMSVIAANNALEHWDRGEAYLPTMKEFYS